MRIKGKTILITAGPTHEKIDDVRYIGNYSTGKMGYSIAKASNELGANVSLISGPTNLNPPEVKKFTQVQSAHEMYEAVISNYRNVDIIIMTAAVADYTPKYPYKGKIKKKSDELSVELVRTKDILQSIGNLKNKNQLSVGFALESENLIEYAKSKLEKKNADLIIANYSNKENSGFSSDNNTVTLVSKDEIKELKTAPKSELAFTILKYIEDNF